MPELWAGIDAGKRTHHCVVINGEGTVLLSRKVANEETDLLEVIAAVLTLAKGRDVSWAVDLTDGGAALLIGLLAAHDQQLQYLPGRIVHHAAATYRGDGKTDAKDARIIADQARMRTDLPPVRRPDSVAV
ncbi:MAG: IS110 family transposase, partial [Actinomycetales bacterium]